MRKHFLMAGFIVLLCQLAFSQGYSGAVIEVEAKGRIAFAPDSFVVLYRLNRSSVNLEDEIEKQNVSQERVGDEEVVAVSEYEVSESSVDVVAMEEVAPPQTQEEMDVERKLRQERQQKERIIQDSLNTIKNIRFDKLSKQIASIGIYKTKAENQEEVSSAYYNEYRIDEWIQIVSLKQYRMADSISRIYGKPLRGEVVDIRMKSNDGLKKKAYAKAMENGRKEGEILAAAMNLKLGKVIGVTTESLGIEEILPVMLRKELSRELRRSDNLKPELYQFMQEFDMNQFIDSKYSKEIIEWSWTEKVMIRFQTNP
ncbi:MAG: hypothetical protein ACK5B6_01055 [Bacteroidia bacterium]|jgi:hypothetical protein